ncbi:MAG TPA: hypothetical protein VK550_27710 [Polyangiaceae bacterium]|nr:hypothetical protein [Polyangiaceae bacterium]
MVSPDNVWFVAFSPEYRMALNIRRTPRGRLPDGYTFAIYRVSKGAGGEGIYLSRQFGIRDDGEETYLPAERDAQKLMYEIYAVPTSVLEELSGEDVASLADAIGFARERDLIYAYIPNGRGDPQPTGPNVVNPKPGPKGGGPKRESVNK